MGGTQGNLDTEGPLTVERHGTAGISTVNTIILGRRPTTRALRIHHTTDMVEGEEVLDTGVNTGLVNQDLLGKLLRQGVTMQKDEVSTRRFHKTAIYAPKTGHYRLHFLYDSNLFSSELKELTPETIEVSVLHSGVIEIARR